MIISTDTIEVLKNFSSINNTIHIKPGSRLSTCMGEGNVAAADVPDVFEETIAIYDLAQFLNVISMFKEPTLSVSNGKQATLREGSATVRYTLAEPSLIPKAPTRVIETEAVAEFNLTNEMFQKLLKASGAMGLEDIIIKGDDGKLIMQAINFKSPSSNSFDLRVGDTDHEFVARVRRENIKILAGSYKATLTKRLLKLDADCSKSNLANLTYWHALEQDSKFYG